jgi:hypothetical protein
VGVVERTRALADVVPPSELDRAGGCRLPERHGYAPALAHTTHFHPLDSARFLRGLGHQRLACLVAHHSYAGVEDEEGELLETLKRFPEERSLVADALAYCDLTIDAAGDLRLGAARRHLSPATVRAIRSGGRSGDPATSCSECYCALFPLDIKRFLRVPSIDLFPQSR